jgi:hypothetical protein
MREQTLGNITRWDGFGLPPQRRQELPLRRRHEVPLLVRVRPMDGVYRHCVKKTWTESRRNSTASQMRKGRLRHSKAVLGGVFPDKFCRKSAAGRRFVVAIFGETRLGSENSFLAALHQSGRDPIASVISSRASMNCSCDCRSIVLASSSCAVAASSCDRRALPS